MTYKSPNVELPSQPFRREIMAYPSYEDANRDILRFYKSHKVLAKNIFTIPRTVT